MSNTLGRQTGGGSTGDGGSYRVYEQARAYWEGIYRPGGSPQHNLFPYVKHNVTIEGPNGALKILGSVPAAAAVGLIACPTTAGVGCYIAATIVGVAVSQAADPYDPFKNILNAQDNDVFAHVGNYVVHFQIDLSTGAYNIEPEFPDVPSIAP